MMPNSQTLHSRRARAKNAARWEQERKAEGYRRVTVMLSPDALARMDRLMLVYGTKQAAVERALEALERLTTVQ